MYVNRYTYTDERGLSIDAQRRRRVCPLFTKKNVSVHTHICMCVYMHICIYIYIYIYICVCVCVEVSAASRSTLQDERDALLAQLRCATVHKNSSYVQAHIYMCIHMYIYTHIGERGFSLDS